MALTQVETSGLSGSGASSNSTTGNVFSQTGPFKNRIINGDMRIDQRNAGAASANTINGYFLDRWQVTQSTSGKLIAQQNAGSVTPPAGFSNYLGVTSQSSYSVSSTDFYNISQFIEGFNFSDLQWGTANAKTVTISFWVRSSLTGTFGGSLMNDALNRAYPFSYTISAANTWEYKTITVAGDTSGTWVGSTNGAGLKLYFALGVGSTYSGTAGAWSGSLLISTTGATSVVGTNGATFYITGVQLEAGTSATQFERRSYGQELALCQRYYYRITSSTGSGLLTTSAAADSSTSAFAFGSFPVPMRIAPTALEQSGTASNYQIRTGGTDRVLTAVPTYWSPTTNIYYAIITTVASGQTAGLGGVVYANAPGAYLGWSAEL
jgi:hypothetical protein